MRKTLILSLLVLGVVFGLAQAAGVECASIVFCSRVEDREPVEPATQFSATDEWVYCHTVINNPGGPTEIHHDWYYQGSLITRNTLSIGTSQNWRTYSAKQISPAWVGKWEVVVKNASGAEIGRAGFEIKPVQE